mmetsp:Transcript_20847/g.31830  ORF Transcript_20847/g.31830 Transcript_20847/m.31830 type:complete len:296 (-) Transcript_20847:72-959(-)
MEEDLKVQIVFHHEKIQQKKLMMKNSKKLPKQKCLYFSIKPKKNETPETSTLLHQWEKQKTAIVSWCPVCQKIIAPKSRKKPANVKVCKACGVIVHPKCGKGFAGCLPKKNENEEKMEEFAAIGKEAPNIPNVTTAEDGSPVSLYDILDSGKKVVVFFYPKSFTPLCTMQNKCFRDNYEFFHYANCEVIGISADTSECQKRFAAQYKLPFHVLSDETGELRKLFNVPGPMGGMVPGRVTYIIAPHSHKIMKVHNSSLAASDHVFVSLQIVASLLQMEAELGSMSLVDFSLLEGAL